MEKIVEVKNLTKQFKNFTAISDVSFDAHKGEIFGLLGPNGAGKTTTIRVLATVLSATSGTATVGGFDIYKQKEEVRKNVGILTTDIGVYERFTGRENLTYFGKLYGLTSQRVKDRIAELVELLQMEAFIDKRAGNYSTGMKQKLAIARSVIHDPEVIIFDEPTSGLDVLAAQTVLDFMKKAKGLGKCVIFSTHHMFDAEKLCDRVAIIHEGKIVVVDTVATIKKSTQTKDLEDAFLKLVKSETARKKSETDKTITPEITKKNFFTPMNLKILMYGLILLGIVLIFTLGSDNQTFRIGGDIIIFAAIGLSFVIKALEKQKK